MSENFANQSNDTPDPNYWRSFKELFKDKETLEKKFNEFEKGVTDDFNPDTNLFGLSRRKFLALLGASAAFAGVACSNYRDKGEIVPYNQQPEEITLGKPNFYASTCTGCVSNCGILIKTREGRPIKVDGNPEHPINQGKICAKGQANILNLYNPERIKNPLKKNYNRFSEVDWKSVDEFIINLLNTSQKEIAIVSHSINSPTTQKLLNELKNVYSNINYYSYELFNDSIRNKAWQKCYGTPHFPLIKWDEAKIILSLESDFLGADCNKIENNRLFSLMRDVDSKKFNRLYVAESGMTLTGINADYRLKIKPENQLEFVLSLLSELKAKGVISSNLEFNYKLDDFIKRNNIDEKKVRFLIKDLSENKGKSIIYAGNSLSEDVHIAVNLLNELLGNKTLFNKNSYPVNISNLSSFDDFIKLVNKIDNNQVDVVIHLNCNPVYHLPEDIEYKKALAKIENVITLTETMNETAQLSKFVLPINHNFESWGDFKTRTGILSLAQPVILPIHNTRQLEAILLTWMAKDASVYDDLIYHDYLKFNWQNSVYNNFFSAIGFDKFWFSALHNGFITFEENTTYDFSFNYSVVTKINSNVDNNSGYTVILRESYSLGDGRFANNGWLQELPHPVSKVTWDNYAAISFNTANELRLKDNDLIEIKLEDRSLKIPVFIQAGNTDKTIVIELGYGREYSGIIASGVGFNANKLLSKNYKISPWIYTNAEVKKVNGKYILASTQEHHSFDIPREQDLHFKRDIVIEGTFAEYLENPNFVKEKQHTQHESIYQPFEYNEVKWGMSIDLNKCLGCGDCVIACNVENNVPVVGKDQVLKSREMQWIRIDRYYSGSPDDPKVSTQPMLCQHCDLAPCENVCPVVATTHSPDGLNQMTYNRCVGTRYCSNNCPYKVRRFNFFDYRDHFKNAYQENPLFALLNNPEVTVRSRGVMEKCTFCIQRIADARSEAIRLDRKVKGSDVTTACQDACPTSAIKFGDINDKEGEFYKYRNHQLGYYSLSVLNIKPNVTYITKLRNTHPEEA